MRIVILLSFALLATGCTFPGQPSYHLAKTIPVSGDGSWDYVKVDQVGRRAYVTHETQVEVLDADSLKHIGVIGNLHGVHGIGFAQGPGRGFISNGKSDSVTIFDLKTLAVLGEVKVGKKPDALSYDNFTERLFAFNGESNSATVIDGKSGKVVSTIALGGGPEFAASDHKGHVFVNLEDTSETLMLDAAKFTVMHRWKVAPGASPSSLAIDRVKHRLFIGCRNRLLIVMNADNGKVIASLPIGDHVDATAFDPETHQVISSTGDGALTIIAQDDPDHYQIVQTLATPKGSKTFGLDAKTHKLFVPAADFGPAQRPSKDNPKGRPKVLPGTFRVLVFEP